MRPQLMGSSLVLLLSLGGFVVDAFSNLVASSFVFRKNSQRCLPSSRRSDTCISQLSIRCSSHFHNANKGTLSMRDSSANYWFSVGDSVKVVSKSVQKAGVNLQHRVGTVVETWGKCDVDPTCCCAEQVERDMAVRVEFKGTETNPNAAGESFLHYFAEEELVKLIDEKNANASDGTASSSESLDGRNVVAFSMDVLPSLLGLKRKSSLFAFDPSYDNDKEFAPEYSSRARSVAFDGMSCSAFKMDHLQSTSQKSKGIFSYDPNSQSSSGQVETISSQSDALPFDGMSCTAFKMDFLQSAGQGQRGIYFYDPTTSTNIPRDDHEKTALPSNDNTSNTLPFDGVSCVAFKMDHLQGSASQKSRGIYSYDPNSPTHS